MENPNIKINTTVTKITGITNEMLIDATSFDQIQHDFQIFIGSLPIVGHNILFDLSSTITLVFRDLDYTIHYD